MVAPVSALDLATFRARVAELAAVPGALEKWQWQNDALGLDWLRMDRLHWRDVFRAIREVVGDRRGRVIVARIKDHRYARRFEPRSWDEAEGFTPEVVTWARRRLNEEQRDNGDPCCDNERVARIGNTAQERRYRRQVTAGCCGSHDWVEVGPDGRRYRLGFNYGH